MAATPRAPAMHWSPETLRPVRSGSSKYMRPAPRMIPPGNVKSLIPIRPPALVKVPVRHTATRVPAHVAEREAGHHSVLAGGKSPAAAGGCNFFPAILPFHAFPRGKQDTVNTAPAPAEVKDVVCGMRVRPDAP